MPIAYKPQSAKAVFIATVGQPTYQAPLTEGRKIAAVAPGMGYECLSVHDDGTRQWAALMTNVAGVFAEWVVVNDRTAALEQPADKGYIQPKTDFTLPNVKTQ